MDVMEAIFSRRSVRAFSSEPVDPGLIGQVVQAGLAAPSGGNLQAWGFVVIQKPMRIKGLRSIAPGIIGEPAAVIALCLDSQRAKTQGGSGSEQMAGIDIGLALGHMLLAAHALGLGACPIGSFHEKAVSLFLELPPGIRLVLLLTLGIPKFKPTSPGRRQPVEVLFSEKWGMPYGQ